MHNITLIEGDGIGPEIADAVIKIIDAAGVKINWDRQTAGLDVIEKEGVPLPNRVIESIKKNKVALKAPVTTPPVCSCPHLNLRNNLRDFISQNLLPCHDLLDLGVELPNVDFLPGILRLHIGTDGQIVVVSGDLPVLRQVGKVPDPLTAGKNGHDALDILRRQPVVVRHLDALAGGINKQRFVVRLALFQHHDTGSNACPKKQIGRELDHAVNKIVIHQVLPDFLLCAAPVHDAGEADDSRRSVGGQPGQGVHDKSQVSL